MTALLAEIEPFWTAHSFSCGARRPVSFPSGGRAWAGDRLARQRMGRADTTGQPAEPGQPYDQVLWERVTAFQQARSLEPDGVVGRETAIILRRAEWVA